MVRVPETFIVASTGAFWHDGGNLMHGPVMPDGSVEWECACIVDWVELSEAGAVECRKIEAALLSIA